MPIFFKYEDKKGEDENGNPIYALKEFSGKLDAVSAIPIIDRPLYRPKKLRKRIDHLQKLVEKYYGPVVFSPKSRIQMKPVIRRKVGGWIHEPWGEDPADLLYEGPECLEEVLASKHKRRKVQYFNFEWKTQDQSLRIELKPGDYKNLRLKFFLELLGGTALLGYLTIAHTTDGVDPSQVLDFVKENYDIQTISDNYKQVAQDVWGTEEAKPFKEAVSMFKSQALWIYGTIGVNYVRRIVRPYIFNAYKGMRIDLSPEYDHNNYTEEEMQRYKALHKELTRYNAHNYTGYQWVWPYIKRAGLWVGGTTKSIYYKIRPQQQQIEAQQPAQLPPAQSPLPAEPQLLIDPPKTDV